MNVLCWFIDYDSGRHIYTSTLPWEELVRIQNERTVTVSNRDCQVQDVQVGMSNGSKNAHIVVF